MAALASARTTWTPSLSPTTPTYALLLVTINAVATAQDILANAVPGLLAGLARMADVDANLVRLVFIKVRRRWGSRAAGLGAICAGPRDHRISPQTRRLTGPHLVSDAFSMPLQLLP